MIVPRFYANNRIQEWTQRLVMTTTICEGRHESITTAVISPRGNFTCREQFHLPWTFGEERLQKISWTISLWRDSNMPPWYLWNHEVLCSCLFIANRIDLDFWNECWWRHINDYNLWIFCVSAVVKLSFWIVSLLVIDRWGWYLPK